MDLVGGISERERRAQSWGDWIASLHTWDLFGGMTFDPRRARRIVPPGPQRFGKVTRFADRISEDGASAIAVRTLSSDVARARVRKFLAAAQERLERRLAAVIAMEYHKNGWPHFHPLLHVEGGLHGGEIATLSRLWFDASGYNRLEIPRSSRQVCEYASKYLVKGLDRGDVMIWPEKGPVKFHDQERFWY